MTDSKTTVWVVYRMGSGVHRAGQNAVCTQAEWETRVLAAPGRDTLIRDGIANEGVAERLARDLQSPPEPPKVGRGRRIPPPPPAIPTG